MLILIVGVRVKKKPRSFTEHALLPNQKSKRNKKFLIIREVVPWYIVQPITEH